MPSAPPLYDVFVSHASEDKEDFVKPLVARLQDEHVDVWYDEFTLHPGQSLRRTIDQGLARSRFAVVVLSPDFFRKEWPQRELDGLVARETIGEESVIIPIWHDLTAEEVVAVSPTLAGVVAIQSSVGLDHVVHEIMRVVRPQGSPLVYARDMLYRYGLAPPVVTDPWWLDIMEASFRPGTAADHGSSVLGVMDLWQFPIPKGADDATGRGERIAWTAMQESWRHHAYDYRICQITPPAIVHEFLESEPGLLEMCLRQPLYAARFAPQLTIPGVGGALEPVFDALLDQNRYSAEERRDPWWREARPNSPVPFCPPFIAFREHGFGDNSPEDLAEMYFTDDISVVTATTALYPQVEYVVWLCSEASSWLPSTIRAVLREGMAARALWLWDEIPSALESDLGLDPYPEMGVLRQFVNKRKRWSSKQLSAEAFQDLRCRVGFSVRLLGLPEDAESIVDEVERLGFITRLFERRF